MIDNFPLICFKLNFLEQDDLNCPTGVVRLHISCWTVEYQLLCKRTSAVVQAHISCCAAEEGNIVNDIC